MDIMRGVLSRANIINLLLIHYLMMYEGQLTAAVCSKGELSFLTIQTFLILALLIPDSLCLVTNNNHNCSGNALSN